LNLVRYRRTMLDCVRSLPDTSLFKERPMPRLVCSRASILSLCCGALAVSSLTVGCGNEGTTTSAGGSGGNGATSTGTNPTSTSTGVGGGDSYTVTFGPVTVPSGQENTQCVVTRLKNLTAAHVGTIHNVLSDGSHHLIVYRTNDTQEQLTPFDCQPFSDLLKPAKGTPLMITQKKDDTLTLPQGVAFSINADQFVRLEMHYINASPAELQVSATSTFVTMPESQFQNEADFLFFGNPDINIPAHSAMTLGPTYLPLPPDLADSKFFGFAGHTHQWGTNVSVATTTGKTGPDTPIYDVPNWQWAEPETVYVDPPLTVPQNGGFHLTCEWQNDSANTVKFGESANDEMCFFWTYYYPSKGAFVCAHTDQFPGGYDLCCPSETQQSVCDMLFP